MFRREEIIYIFLARCLYIFQVDERAVLKHFDWPEQKADALREAAFGYCDLKKVESEALLSRDDPRQPCGPALKKMQALLEKYAHNLISSSCFFLIQVLNFCDWNTD